MRSMHAAASLAIAALGFNPACNQSRHSPLATSPTPGRANQPSSRSVSDDHRAAGYGTGRLDRALLAGRVPSGAEHVKHSNLCLLGLHDRNIAKNCSNRPFLSRNVEALALCA